MAVVLHIQQGRSIQLVKLKQFRTSGLDQFRRARSGYHDFHYTGYLFERRGFGSGQGRTGSILREPAPAPIDGALFRALNLFLDLVAIYFCAPGSLSRLAFSDLRIWTIFASIF